MADDRARSRMLAVASVSLLLSILVWFNYSAVLPRIVAEWELSGIHAGLIFSAFQAGYLVAIIPAGILVDRYSPLPCHFNRPVLRPFSRWVWRVSRSEWICLTVC